MAKALAEKKRRTERNRLSAYRPYVKQQEFHAAGADKRERLFMAGNQLGKTLAGAAEMAMHLTGRYPEWWRGRRFDRQIIAIAGSETGEMTRDGVQRLLIGQPSDESAWGTGMIPYDALIDYKRSVGVADALDTVIVKHASGGNSTLLLKTYTQGRRRWQANTVHAVWMDEEPPIEIYTEALTRTNATGGLVMVTFTPLMGMSEVVLRFIQPAGEDLGQRDRVVTQMTIDDAEHYSQEERARIIASYPEHEREARTLGIPVMGSGVVFPVAEASIICDPFAIPPHWVQIAGIDFGYDHPFGAVKLAWNRDADVIYVVAEYRQSKATPIIHAAAIKPWGDTPVAWPHDGLQHDKGSGDELAKQYKAQGLRMLPERATFPDGGNGVEAGVMEMLDRMQTGRWKVFSTCQLWLEERRLYHRKDGEIVKINDDLLSASRYALMMKRFARPAARPPRQASYSAGDVVLG